jgi:tellurite resistance protein
MIDHHAALIYTMTLVSAADGNMTDAEIGVIGDIVGHLPIFKDYDSQGLTRDLGACTRLLQREDGMEAALEEIKAGLPRHLRETAYAVACDVAAADSTMTQEEIRMLELVRHRLSIDRLVAAAIERGTRARFARHEPRKAAEE